MEMDEPILRYNKLSRLRNLIKATQQISWDMTQFEKRFSFVDIKEDQFQDYLATYISFGRKIQEIADNFEKESDDDIVKEMLNEKKNGKEKLPGKV